MRNVRRRPDISLKFPIPVRAHRSGSIGRFARGARRSITWLLLLAAGVQLAAAETPAGAHARPQELLVTIRVLAAGDASPLANAELIDRTTGSRAFTRESGEARVRVLVDQSVELRVRQLGFAFVDLTLRHAELRQRADTVVVVRLDRIPFALPTHTTSAARGCPAVDPQVAPLALWALALLREGAERYESFRKAYPFRVEIERRTLDRSRPFPPPAVRATRERAESGSWGERYQPGRVVEVHSLGYSVPILFIATLGDPVFWDHHCVSTAALEGEDGARRVRLQFEPVPHVRASDWEGAALIDSASNMLTRIEFKLRVNQSDGPRRFEGYTTFKSPSPLIVIPDTTLAMWWRSAPEQGAEWGLPHVAQQVHSARIEFRRAKPPQR